jgi:hypothetical protein
MNNGTAYKSSYYYTQVNKNFPTDSDGRSFALRMLIHYVGDLHQPLHAVAEVDSTYPSGDKGGNAEAIPSICGAANLHAVWDSVAYNYCGYPVLVSLIISCDVRDHNYKISTNFFVAPFRLRLGLVHKRVRRHVDCLPSRLFQSPLS